MKPLLVAIVFAAVSLGSMPAVVHGWTRISIYSDTALGDCTLSDTSPRVATIYVMATHAYCATGVRFRVAQSAGFTGVWLSETSPFVTIGTTPVDFSAGFGDSRNGTFVILTMSYQLAGTSTCSQLSIAPPPGFTEPLCVGCLGVEVPCFGYDTLNVNCEDPSACNPLATESTTWGRVKALYRN